MADSYADVIANTDEADFFLYSKRILPLVSSNISGTVLGFSLTGSSIPPGDAVLVELEFNPLWDQACITDAVISDTAGNGLITDIGCVDLDFMVIDGCTDASACNYNLEATIVNVENKTIQTTEVVE